MRVKELRELLAQASDDAIVCVSDITDICINLTSGDIVGNNVYLNCFEEFPEDWYDEDGVEINYERELLRHKISAILMHTTEGTPLACDIVIGEDELQGLSTLELPRVVSAFQDHEAVVWFNLLGYKEPMEFDEMTTNDLLTIYKELTENN